MDVVLRVYLDQNKWIDLSRAMHGRPGGEPFEDAFAMAKAAVDAGQASFVLSGAHYYETHRRADWTSRTRLVATMIKLSRMHTIAPAHVIVPAEIDAALQEFCSSQGPPPTALQVFGVGVGHAFGVEPIAYTLPPEYAEMALPPGLRATIEREATDFLEVGLLLGQPPGESVPIDSYQKLRDLDVKFAQGQADLANRLVEHGYEKGERLTRAISADEMVDFLEPLTTAAQRRRVDLGQLFDQGPEVAEAFLRAIPSRWVTRELRRQRHATPQQAWEPNDLNDIVALSIASPYCDVVVTERQWAHRLNAAGVEEAFGTKVIADLRKLPELLVTIAH